MASAFRIWVIVWGLMVGAVGCGCGAAPAKEGGQPPRTEPKARVAVALRFEAADTDAGDPRTRVRLVRIQADGTNEATELGTFDGVCNHTSIEGATILRAKCGFMRVPGVVISVVRAKEGLSAVVEGNELARRTLATVRLPSGAQIDAIRPSTLPNSF